MKCAKCGAENVGNAKFCAVCGAPLDTAEAPTGTAPAPTAAPAPAAAPAPSRHRGRKAAIAALAVAIAAAGGGAGYYYGIYRPEQEKIMQEQALRTEKCGVRVAVSATGWDTSAGGSRLPLRVKGETLAGTKVDRIMYVDSAGKGLELHRGSYEISVAGSPIAADGTVYVLPQTVAKVKISAKIKKGATVVASSKYKFELTPVEALDVTDDMLAAAKKYAEGDKDARKDGYSCDAEALATAATKRRDDAVAAKQAADEAAAKAEQERQAAEEAERAAQEQAAKQQSDDDAFVATARRALGIPDSLQGVSYKRGDPSYWEGAGMETYPIEFYNSDGEMIASAYCTKDGQPAHTIWSDESRFH